MSDALTPFFTGLDERAARIGSRLCVGIDPRPETFPDEFRIAASAPRKLQANALEHFGRTLIDLCADVAAVFKPQSAFFERLGADGIAALEAVTAHAKDRGIPVIGDVKRGDIGSTAAAYAEGLLPEDGGFDALTINPYLGHDGVAPFLDRARALGRGLYVLVRTSNPSSEELQELQLRGGGRLCDRVAELVAAWSASDGGGSLGAVVGATHPGVLAEMRQALPGVSFLVPGVGAQGATMKDVVAAFDEHRRAAVINVSRGISCPWGQAGSPSDWKEEIRAAAKRFRDELEAALDSRQ